MPYAQAHVVGRGRDGQNRANRIVEKGKGPLIHRRSAVLAPHWGSKSSSDEPSSPASSPLSNRIGYLAR